ncbi:hypothetical protein, partial [Cellulomonas bogoriensis]|uniref:hypothetical protein n=1 Tax=Cellulomonas bogoriensis TaxID=301388 RepID=UPI000551F9A3
TVLALQPRTTRGTVARWAPRAAAAALLLQLATLTTAVDVPGAAPLVLAALGLLIALLAVPLGRGWRSVGFSRVADGLEGLAAVLALPVALVGAGAIELMRQVTS